MNSVFETIGRLSTELAKATEEQKRLQALEDRYAEGLKDSSDAYNLVKGQDAVVLNTFKIVKGNKEEVQKLHEAFKVKNTIAKAQVDILERDLKIYKDKYAKLEDLYQNHDNTMRFYDVTKEKDKPN